MSKEKNDIYFYQGKNNKVNYDYQLSDILVEIETFLCKNIEKTENLCFLIGSGCSSTAIPLMKDTFKKVKEPIIKNSREDLLGNFKDSEDLEKYLNWLNKAIDFLKDEESIDYKETKKDAQEQLIKSIDINYSNEVALKILELYKKFYNIIFRIRNKSKNPINVFTTNYDLFNEKALESLKINYCNGFNGFIERVFEPSIFKQRIVDEENRYKEKWNPLKRYVRLYKIHGSIDWIEKDDKIQQVQEYSGKENILIYPTQAKHFETQYTPYSELFREMSIKLQSPNTTLIILGYGFSDDHINNLIAQSLTNEDFNLIILSSLKEERAKEFFNKYNDNTNIHFIGGKNEKGKPLHYFDIFLSILNGGVMD
ncbi:SIR2 family protein [Fusobacterium nucleatum]|uniref:SIR2 family protein n=1 Tax=Fusobacterium nucleatum TaxID=851 RepID=UPI0030D3D73C